MSAESKKQLIVYLQEHSIMILTTQADELWCSIVYFVSDEDGYMYFMSDPNTTHCRNIEKNNHIAAAIVDSSQKITDLKKGVQLVGQAFQMAIDDPQLQQIIDAWNKKNTGFENVLSYENVKNNNVRLRMFKIVPTKLKFYNEQLYGPEGSVYIDYS